MRLEEGPGEERAEALDRLTEDQAAQLAELLAVVLATVDPQGYPALDGPRPR